MKLQLHYFKRATTHYKAKFLASLFCALFCAVLSVTIPVILKKLLQALPTAPVSQLLTLGALIATCIVLSILATILLYISLDSFGGLFIKDLQARLRSKLLSCDQSYIDTLGTQRLSHILYTDTLEVFRVIGHHFPQLIASALIIVGTLGLSLTGSKYIALYLLVSVCMGIAVSMVSRRAIFKASSQTNARLKQIHEITNQFTQTLLSAKANCQGSYYEHKFDTAIETFIETSKQEDKRIYLFSGLTNNFNLVVEILLSILVSIPLSGRSIPNYAFYVFIFSLTMKQAEKIEGLLQQIIRSEICFKNIEEVLCLDCPAREIELKRIDNLCLDKVSFGYDDEMVLSNYSLSLKSGEYLFLKGENGYGKSTILKLIRGLYRAKSGTVSLNNIDINDVSLESLHKNILYIGQDEVILNETPLEYLIEVCKPILTLNELEASEILAQAGIKDINSPIVDNGQSLSGGQRKKLLFAKLIALSEKASVILIDELHSGLDVQTKAKLDSFIKALIERKDKIVVVVTHEADK